MITNQPAWKLIANLGDINPIDYGGYFVYEDTTGVYPPEAELLEVPEDENGTYTIYRFVLEPCTYENGILSDNKYHKDHAAWFADKLDGLGLPVADLIANLCSDNTVAKAIVWRAIGDYWGFLNLDSYPLSLTRKEAIERYRNHPKLKP